MIRRASIVMLAWNQWPLTRRALDSLLATDLDAAEVIVVDNGSTDATPDALRDYAGRVRVVTLPSNLGFVRGNNAGIAAADAAGDIVLVNNDLEFGQADWLARMRRCAQGAEAVGIVGCRLTDGEGRLLHAGTRVYADGAGVQIASGRVERDVGQYAGGDRVVQGVVFAAAYLKREVIDAIGALHEDYHTYAEDTDYCLRARAAGWLTVLCGGVTLVHRQHGSTGADSAWREQLLGAGRTVFLRHWRAALDGAYAHQVVLETALDFPRATASLARPLVRALDEAGVDVRYRSLWRDTLPRALAENGDSRDHVLNTLRARRVPVAPRVVVGLGDPALWTMLRGDRRIGYAGFDETPAGEALAAWHGVDEAWVPEAWQREALVDAGYERPVFVMPWGVDPDYWHPQMAAPRNAHGETVFLCVAAWNARDRPWRVLRAFSQAFTQRDAVRLVAWIDPQGVDLAAATRELGLDVHGGRVSVLPQRRAPEEMQAVIWRSADLYVSTSSRRDGVDALQAAAVGMPVVTVDGEESNAIEPLRDAWHSRAALAQESAAASAHVRRDRAWSNTATLIRDRLAAIERDLPLAPRATTTRLRGAGRIVVLGMHRSGTSCVAGLLQLMGAYGGDESGFLHNPGENPRGFFERGDVHAACVQALFARDGDWSIPLGWNAVHESDARTALRRALAPVLAELDTRPPWFLKEPRLCLLWPECADLAADAVVVHVVREPGAVAASIAARDGLTAPHALALWEHYNLAALSAGAAHRRVGLDYHALLAAPVAQATRLHASLCDAGVRGLRLPSGEEIAAWVSPRLARRRHARTPPLSASQAGLWRGLADGSALQAPVPALSPQSEALLLKLAAEHREVLRRNSHRGMMD